MFVWYVNLCLTRMLACTSIRAPVLPSACDLKYIVRSARAQKALNGRETQLFHHPSNPIPTHPSRSASRIERPGSRNQLGTSGAKDPERRNKLRSALVKKLLSKYHPGIANSKTESIINAEVDKLMNMTKVTEADLHAVEGRVRQQSNEEIAWITTNPFKRVTAFKSGAQDEWAMVNELMVKAGFDAESRKQEARRAQKQHFKKQLDDQITELDARRRAEKMEKEAESAKVLSDVQSYITAMDQKKAEQARFFENLRKEREKEMEFTRKKHAQLRQEKQDDEQREMAKLRKLQQDEFERLQNKKRENQEKMIKWKAENEANMKFKEQQRMRQQQEDIDFARKAQAALDEKEERRRQELLEMEEKMKARAKQGQELGDKLDAQAREDEARMLKIQEEARLKAEAQFQEKLRREHQKKLEIRNTLDRQVQDLHDKKNQEKIIIQKQAEVFKKQANEATMEEQRKKMEMKKAQHQYRMQLEDQLRFDVKLRPARELMMSEVERKINKTFKTR